MRVQRLMVEKEAEQDQADIDLSLIDDLINTYRGKAGNLIPLLQKTQDIYGYIPRQAMVKISEQAGLELSDMYGVATFYTQFRLNPVGKNIIKVCHGTACHVQNAGTITESLAESLKVKDGETTPDGMFTLESVACLGCCSLAPVMMIGDETYGKLTGKQAVRIIHEIRLKENSTK
ncbi:NADH-quinone oxidoreductase subunit NuoE [Saccharicrinis sp. FJH62]|uniref:NADH-quinone oxidoreductase subunit NuoE n=1 Tax=Saccharicrinis sp. FJH62 TaxID=3344657 RepID=UPI0035D4E64F